MIFRNPEFLLLLVFLPLLYLLMRRRERSGRSSVRFSDITHLKQGPQSFSLILRGIVKFMRLIAIALFIIALARPQVGLSKRNIQTEGIAIALVIDCSGSMEAQDFPPNRLEAAKAVIADFIDERLKDEICAVVFAAESRVGCPLTLDYKALKDIVAALDHKKFSEEFVNTTAIGLGLAQGIDLLEKSDAKSKIVVLLTDGANHAGFEMPPEKATAIAKTLGIRVYTIGMGRPASQNQRGGFFPIRTNRNELDEGLLKQIAKTTGGKYFRADNEKKLGAIYTEIDELETHKIERSEFDSYDEKMAAFVIAGLLLVLLEIILAYTRFLKLP